MPTEPTNPPASAVAPPTHVAIIMDGNGRWARARGLERLEGHWQGYRTLKRIVYAADEIGVRYLTVYGFSSENWRRPGEEVGGLMKLMQAAMRAEIEELVQNGIRVRVSGRMSGLPAEVRDEFMSAAHLTEDNTRLTFNLAINYGGRAEIVDAVRALGERIAAGEMTPDEVTEDAIHSQLYHPEIPDPDLLIRTAGERRLSNFLLWETAYSELWVTHTLWPDFSREDLEAAIEDYHRRVRRFGAVVE